jgi:hypothetical protein
MRRLERCVGCSRPMWLLCECDGPHYCRDCINAHAVPVNYELDQDYLTVYDQNGKKKVSLKATENSIKSVYINRAFRK